METRRGIWSTQSILYSIKISQRFFVFLNYTWYFWDPLYIIRFISRADARTFASAFHNSHI